MNEQQLRAHICAIGKRAWDRGFVAGNEGNISARLPDGTILCSPTRVSKGFMAPAELVVVDGASGAVLRGGAATSEIRMHIAIYQERADVTAVVHTHAPHATAFAVTASPIPSGIHPELDVFVGPVPLVPYRHPGTWELADALRPLVKGTGAVLLTSHGLVAYGRTVDEAYARTEIVDAYCRTLILARPLGTLRPLGASERARLEQTRADYEQSGGSRP